MPRPQLVALAGLAALAVAMGIGRFAFTPILPMMQADGVLDVVGGGWLASANYVGYLVGALTAVSLPIAPATAVRVGLYAVGLTTLAMGLASGMAAWLLLRFAAGIASAWVLVFASAWCLEHFQAQASAQQRARLSATVFAGVGIGIAAAGAVCLILILADAPAVAAWRWLGGASLALAIALPRFGDARAAAAPAAPTRRWDAESLRLVACYGAFGFGYIIPATFISTMARDLVRDPTVYGWSWPVFGAAAAASTFAATLARSRFSDRNVWIAGHIAMGAGVMMPLAVPGLAGIVLSALLVGGTFMVVTMVGMQEARRIAGAGARRLMAAMTAAFAAGQIAGPLAVSALAAAGAGYDAALACAGAFLIASALALFHPHPRRPP